MLKFSIIIPVKEINPYIKESIPHILNLDYPKDQYEILILPNDKPKHIPKYLQDKRIKIMPTGKVSPAVKRDMGAALAQGKILAFIDDDSYPREDWLVAAEKTFNNLPGGKDFILPDGQAEGFSKDFVAVNGPAITPSNATMREKMSGGFFESRLGGGATHRCRDIGKSFEVADAPSVNLLVRKDAFFEVGGFGSEYWPGEDSLFCQKLRDNGYRIWHQNNLIIFHHRRKTLKDHLKQVAGYGRHRGNFFRKNIGCSRKLTYIIPSIFLLGNLFMALFWIGIWVQLLIMYIIIVSFNLCSCRSLPFYLIYPTVVLTFVSHLTYGAFFLRGLFTRDIMSSLR